MSKTKPWFIKKRGSYLPCSWQGWLTYIPFTAYLVTSFLAVDRNANSVSDILYGVVPQAVSAVVVLTWVAEHTS